MKKGFIIFFAFISQINFGQNTFPTLGNVGIGTVNPLTTLEIVGTVKIQSSNSNYDENLRLLPSLLGDYSSIALGAVNGNSGTGIGQWTLIRYPAVNNYMFSLRYNSTDFLNILNNGNVGIGTTHPLAKFEINGGNLLVRNITNVDEVSSIMIAHSVNINSVDDTGTSIRTITKNAGGNNYALQFFTEDSYLVGQTEKLRIQGNGNVGIGSRNPDSKLTVKGKIHAEEVKVDVAVPADYVFEKYYSGQSTLKSDYALLSLSEVEKFTKENYHLPNVPSAKEIKENGLLVGEMSNILLQKIEEMTLYMIELKKENEKMKKDIMKLEQRN